MTNKISNFVSIILLFLMQSCSGGRIGNFLELSFKNNNADQVSQTNINNELISEINPKDNNTEQVSQININNKLTSEIKPKDNKLNEKEDESALINFNNESKPQVKANSSSILKTDLNKIKKQNQNYNPKSYRIFVILKQVDPSYPTEDFSRVLMNGNINFEIEKIELIPELNLIKN